MITLAQAIPAKIRTAIYSLLGTLTALEQIWDVLPSVLEGKVLATANVLGFVLAAANVKKPPAPLPPPPPPPGVPENFPNEFA